MAFIIEPGGSKNPPSNTGVDQIETNPAGKKTGVFVFAATPGGTRTFAGKKAASALNLGNATF